MRRKSYKVISLVGFIAGIFLILIFPGISRADTLTFQLDYLYNGYSPSGSSPWPTATFVDLAPNTVELTMTNNLVSNEFIDGVNGKGKYSNGGWFFNVNPDKLSVLSINYVSGSEAAQTLKGSYQANGDGFYNIVFAWKKFSGGNTAVYDFTVSEGSLTATDFNFLSSPGSGSQAGPFYSAAKVQGIVDPNNSSNTVSGWVAATADPNPVPEPSTIMLLGSGLVSLGLWGRRKFKGKD